MKVLLHTIWGIPPHFVGGTERFLINLAKKLRQRGIDAVIVCSNMDPVTTIEGVPVLGRIPERYISSVKEYGYANEHFFKNRILGDAVDIRSLRRFSQYVSEQLAGFDYDVAHLNSFFSASFLDKKLPFHRFVLTTHENDHDLDHYWGKGAFELLKKVALKQGSSLPGVAARMTGSEWYATRFSEWLKLPIGAIPLGVDEKTYARFVENPFLRQKLSPNGEIIFLFPARFEMVQKGHDIAIMALGMLKKRGFRFKAVFSGLDKEAYGGNLATFKDLLAKNDIADDTLLTRFDSMKDAFGCADIVVCPERFSSFGLAVCESLALGLPTVLTPIPTFKEIAEGFRHAHFTDGHAPGHLESTLRDLIEPVPRIDQEEAARFRERWSFDHCVDAYMKTYQRVIQGGDRTPVGEASTEP